MLHARAAEEVENPPDSGAIYSHTETPRMRRLIQDYMEKNPQVQQTSGIVAASKKNHEELVGGP